MDLLGIYFRILERQRQFWSGRGFHTFLSVILFLHVGYILPIVCSYFVIFHAGLGRILVLLLRPLVLAEDATHDKQRLYQCFIIKILGKTRRLHMRGQQITPWSIYNKTIVDERHEGEKEEKEVVRFPKIDKKSGRIVKKEERFVEKGRHSARQVIQAMKHDKQAFSSYFSELIPKNQENDKKKQQQMYGKQAEVERIMNDRIVLQMLKAELKKQYSQLSFMNLLKEEEEQAAKQAEEEKTLNIDLIKRDHSFLLNRSPIPRVNVDKNVMIISINQDECQPRSQQKPALDSQAIKAILKKEINSMISNRMKIMGKAKQLAFKP